MSHLCFSPQEYHVLSLVCCPLNLNHHRPHRLKRLLVRSLTGGSPELAERISHLCGQEIRLIRDHFREVRHGLTAEEVGLFAQEGRILFRGTRFFHLTRAALVEQFRQSHPGLAAKLNRLSERQFDVLLEQVNERLDKGA